MEDLLEETYGENSSYGTNMNGGICKKYLKWETLRIFSLDVSQEEKCLENIIGISKKYFLKIWR